MRNPSSSTSSFSKAAAAATTSASAVSSKSTPCCSKVGLKRGPWTPEEDELLANYIKKEGEGRWRTLPKRAGLLRCGKSCRLRWMNYLRPSVKRGQIAPDEEDLILRLHRLLGNRWSLIAGRIPGRTDNEIKNYWNTHLSKKLISQGIDPRTHKPLNPDSSSSAALDRPIIINNNSNKPAASSPSKLTNPHARTSNPNPNVPSSEDQLAAPIHIANGNSITISNKENGYLQGKNISPTDLSTIVHGYANMGTSIDSDHASTAMGLRNNNIVVHGGNCNEEDGDINCCSEDIFSSFLNSLINEDPFAAGGQHQLQQQAALVVQPSNGMNGINITASTAMSAGSDDVPLMNSSMMMTSTAPSTATPFGWESALLMSSAFIQNDHPHSLHQDQTE